jgi:hypothetical protein
MGILAQLFISPYFTSNKVVLMNTYMVLNGKLYLKLPVSLEGPALQGIVSCRHLWASAYHMKPLMSISIISTNY